LDDEALEVTVDADAADELPAVFAAYFGLDIADK